jgi:hypothetical protein
MAKFNKAIYNSSGSWTCPAGVTEVMLIGYGGGGGGGGGVVGFGSGGGGGGSIQSTQYITGLVPNTNYTITIGAGGAGGTQGNNGKDGYNTTFSTLATFACAGGGGVGSLSTPYSVYGGGVVTVPSSFRTNILTPLISEALPGCGGAVPGSSSDGYAGIAQVFGLGYAGGTGGLNAGLYSGSGGGGGGPGGVGGNGVNGVNGGSGNNGNSAAANTGAGGSGGGSCSYSPAGTGGSGGSGSLTIIWVD